MMRKIIGRMVRKRKAAEVETLVGHVEVGEREELKVGDLIWVIITTVTKRKRVRLRY